MDILKELEKNNTVLLIMPSGDYNGVSIDVAKQLSGKTVGYITLSKTFPAIKENFEKNGVDLSKFVFVDAISKTFKEVQDTDQCYFVSSPAAFTELAIKIGKLLKHGFEYIIFDSITNLSVYEKKAPVAKFVSNTVARVRDTKSKAVFYAVKVTENDPIVKESSMFVDRAIDLSNAYTV